MSDPESAPKPAASFWAETSVEPKRANDAAPPDQARAVIQPGFLVHARMLTMRADLKRNFFALDRLRQMSSRIFDRFAQVSADKDETVHRLVRSDALLALAEFFYAIHALRLTGPDDGLVLLDLHNARAAALAKRGDGEAAGRPFTEFELLHFEEIWRASPGSLEHAVLARFLKPAVPSDSVEPFLEACEAAGFVWRKAVCRTPTVASTGLIEAVLAECLGEIASGS